MTTPTSMAPETPTPIATIDSPRAMMMISPCRSAKWCGEPPPLDAEERRSGHVEPEREQPQRALGQAVGERRAQ